MMYDYNFVVEKFSQILFLGMHKVLKIMHHFMFVYFVRMLVFFPSFFLLSWAGRKWWYWRGKRCRRRKKDGGKDREEKNCLGGKKPGEKLKGKIAAGKMEKKAEKSFFFLFSEALSYTPHFFWYERRLSVWKHSSSPLRIHNVLT